MNFLVYEQEPLVRDDIVETIKTAFSGVVHFINQLDELKDNVHLQNHQTIIILSVSGRDIHRSKQDVISYAGDAHLVVICDDPPVDSTSCGSAHFVQRPFTSQTLLVAIKTALSYPLKDPS